MKGDYPDDNFTENDVLACLEAAGLQYRKGGSRYILSQCPLHEDKNPSAQIYKDDWFVKCHAGCEGGRFHITKAFPNLRSQQSSTNGTGSFRPRPHGSTQSRSANKDSQNQVKYKTVDLMDFWKSLPEIPSDHEFKTIDIQILNDLGWRYDVENERYFIPYFSASKQSIPFAQWRNLRDGPRFNFWKDTKPTMYGTWNLDNDVLFLVEGASDAAVLDYVAVPWIAAPSAASQELVKALAGYCKQNDIKIVYAGDNDAPGDKLREALDEVMPYRVKQPPKKYKDWGDFLVAEGFEAVNEYAMEELFPKKLELPPDFVKPDNWDELSDVEQVQAVFPGAEQLEIVDDPEEKIVRSNHSNVGSSQKLF